MQVACLGNTFRHLPAPQEGDVRSVVDQESQVDEQQGNDRKGWQPRLLRPDGPVLAKGGASAVHGQNAEGQGTQSPQEEVNKHLPAGKQTGQVADGQLVHGGPDGSDDRIPVRKDGEKEEKQGDTDGDAGGKRKFSPETLCRLPHLIHAEKSVFQPGNVPCSGNIAVSLFPRQENDGQGKKHGDKQVVMGIRGKVEAGGGGIQHGHDAQEPLFLAADIRPQHEEGRGVQQDGQRRTDSQALQGAEHEIRGKTAAYQSKERYVPVPPPGRRECRGWRADGCVCGH
ncbi:hypothetical protein [Bacteroides caccae]|uniref:hypothetical protein n=1 Tax=Bacteroides caccae TaxID=47678 RepID=UPI001F00C304